MLTGATGFFGKNFVNSFNIDNFKLICVSRKLSSIKPQRNVIFVQADLKVISDIEAIFQKYKPQIVINAATIYPYQTQNEFDSFRLNMKISLNLLQICIKYKISNFINISSAFVYKSINKNLSEDDEVAPFNNYSIAKFAFEEVLSHFCKLGNFDAVSLRLFHVYGPNDHEKRLIPSVINSIINNEKEIELSSCEQVWDVIYVDDIVKLINILIKNYDNWGIKNHEIYNVGLGVEINLRDIVFTIKYLMKSDINIKFSVSIGNMEYMKADISKITTKFNWIPSTNITEGLEKTIPWYENNQ
ncbi:MAG: NAD(P)-dependent oxidoreductase [Candidatus Heimdallarchaeota archaeon]|nr:NAD(P)-dependent oxidoreductase [Candidatus Heimdallarchaeota archaeon]